MNRRFFGSSSGIHLSLKKSSMWEGMNLAFQSMKFFLYRLKVGNLSFSCGFSIYSSYQPNLNDEFDDFRWWFHFSGQILPPGEMMQFGTHI